MKRFAKMLLLSLYFSCMFSVLNVQAVYNKTFRYENTETVRVDLNGDGKAEVIKLETLVGGDSSVLQIISNGKVILDDSVMGASINDIYSKDRYIEVIAWYGEGGADGMDGDDLRIYRYNGKKVIRYAAARYTGGYDIKDMTRLMRKGNYCYYRDFDVYLTAIRSDGKGVISMETNYELYGEQYEIRRVRTYYRVRQNYIRYKKDGYAIETGKGYYYSRWLRIAYKYPKTGSNRTVFIVKRGEGMKIIKWKVTPENVYMQVKREGKPGTGWILYERGKDYR